MRYGFTVVGGVIPASIAQAPPRSRVKGLPLYRKAVSQARRRFPRWTRSLLS